MKKWLKSGVCNSAWVMGVLFTGEKSKSAAGKKRRENTQIRKRRRATWIQTPPRS